jgi:hypothetical protein
MPRQWLLRLVQVNFPVATTQKMFFTSTFLTCIFLLGLMNKRSLIIFALLVMLGISAWLLARLADEPPKRLVAQSVSDRDVLDDLKNVVGEKPNVGDELKMEKHRHE